jgi:hypothetical protein
MIISHMNAATEEPTKFIPAKDFQKPSVLAETLARLGFPVPSSVTKLAAAGQPLGSAGFRVTLDAVDSALSSTVGLKVHQKIALKLAIERAGLFEGKR